MATALLASCAWPANPGSTPPGSTSPPGTTPDGTVPGTTPAASTPAGLPPGTTAGTGVTYQPFGATPPQTPLEVLAVKIKLVPKAGGPTMADLDADTDFLDDNDPKIDVIVEAGDYGLGLTAPNATIEVRGHSTRETRQKSYTMRFKKEAPLWRKQDNLMLNKHPYDLTRVRNKLSFDLFQGIPDLTSPTCTFATAAIDDVDFGFFTQVEKMDKKFLANHGLDAKGNFYKAESFAFQPNAALKPTVADGPEKKAFQAVLGIAGAADHTKLLAMLAAVNDEKQPINDVIAQYFDRANYVTWLATNILTGNVDTNSQNFYLYAATTSPTWRFCTWDYDGGWGYYEQKNEARPDYPPRWGQGLSNWWGATLHRRFLREPANVKQVVERVDQLASQFFTADRVKAQLDVYRPVVKAAIAKKPDLERLPVLTGTDKVAEWEAEYAKLYDYVPRRLAAFKATLERPMPVYMGDPTQEGGSWVFNWDESFDLQGDGLTYDFAIAKAPTFAAGEIVSEAAGLKTNSHRLAAPLAAGTYYWRVIIRDTKDPANNWQIPFDLYTAPDTSRNFAGMRQFVLP